MSKDIPLLSVVVPVYNEADALPHFHDGLIAVVKKLGIPYEIIYTDDGSTDESRQIISKLAHRNIRVKLVSLSRNFGKEYALTAGIASAEGNAIITIDADGQHPVELIPELIEQWQAGGDVIIGVRNASTSISSRAFYTLFNRITHEELVPHSTDFRLIDRKVVTEFLKLEEQNRLTRGLIDWLGFNRVYVTFTARPRRHGSASYSARKLRQLALDSFVSLSSVPLMLFGYLGVIITAASLILGLAVLIEQVILRDPLAWHFTGTAMLGILTLFLVGILLMSQGMIALYISHIHTQTKRRPLYIIDKSRSIGLK